MASFGFGVLYTSSSRDYLVEIIIYVAFLAIPPPIIILAYAYVIESRGLGRAFSAHSVLSDGSSRMATIGNADDEHNFVKEWSKWAENNTKKGRVSSLSSDGQHSGGGVEEQSLCPICIDEMQKEEEVRQLPCGHMMHLACFDLCYTKHLPHHGRFRHQCPLCRVSLGPVFASSRGSWQAVAAARRSNPSRMLPESIWLA